MGIVQRILLAFLPREKAAAAEAESRNWMVKCNTCGTEQSIWEMGGIRSGASGTKTLRARCEKCGKNEWHTVYYAG